VALGAGGRSRGEVWVDDVVLKELGPEPGRTLVSIVGLVAQQAVATARRDAAGAPDPVATGAAVLQLGVKPDALQFDRSELRVKAGQRVRIVFTNTDHMAHNLVLIMAAALARIGQLADQMAASAQGRQQNYVPDTPDVLASTPVLEPGARFELTFTAPAMPGEYTYVCTIPGHWRVMRGTLVVEPAPRS
jgi:plastocyanin